MTIKNTQRSDEEDQAERGEAEIVVPGTTSNQQQQQQQQCDEPEIVVKPTSGKKSPPARRGSAAVVLGAAETNDNLEEPNGLPSYCYCPITKRIMQDPVVHPNGDSYEKAAVMEREDDKELLTFYPNRALKAYIERELERYEESGSMRGTLRRLDNSLRTGWDKFVEKTGVPFEESKPLPDEFYCTLTLDLCHEPVIDPDGYTYEREAIVHWVRNNGDSPVTRKALTVDQLYDNNAILTILLEEAEKPEEEVHPCIRRWKEEMSSPISTSIVPYQPTTTVNNEDTANGGEGGVNGVEGGPAYGATSAQSSAHYPTTPEEMEDRIRREHRISMITLILILIIIAFALVYLPFYMVVFALAFCSCLYARKRFYDQQRGRIQ